MRAAARLVGPALTGRGSQPLVSQLHEVSGLGRPADALLVTHR